VLIQGCKREEEVPPVDTNEMASADSNAAPMIDTNTPMVPPTNQVVAPVTPAAPVAPVAPVVPEVQTPATTEYVIVRGDTLGKIAKANHISLKALEDANPGVTPTKLKVGQKLQVPASTEASTSAESMTSTDMSGGETYSVKSGDTLSRIAKANGVSLKALEAANPNVDPNHIKVGQKLNIPVKAEAPAATTANTPPAVSSPVPAAAAPAPAPSTPPTQQ